MQAIEHKMQVIEQKIQVTDKKAMKVISPRHARHRLKHFIEQKMQVTEQ